VVWLLRHRLRPVRFANYLYILPAWFAIMFYTGVILETRIYGELTPYIAVACVLLLERYLLEDRDDARIATPGALTTHPELPLPSAVGGERPQVYASSITA
jgi:hypothetical protein